MPRVGRAIANDTVRSLVHTIERRFPILADEVRSFPLLAPERESEHLSGRLSRFRRRYRAIPSQEAAELQMRQLRLCHFVISGIFRQYVPELSHYDEILRPNLRASTVIVVNDARSRPSSSPSISRNLGPRPSRVGLSNLSSRLQSSSLRNFPPLEGPDENASRASTPHRRVTSVPPANAPASFLIHPSGRTRVRHLIHEEDSEEGSTNRELYRHIVCRS
ncbi:hypothetical protein K491DRAFT_141257 [Lophiostoma macrostomum CBS 122681]|uniref:Uncharacterized protein n=1 Tax=Lophiostoma macrostomum CBS 122681 TaxID=1314788 RepID=A0A6A6SR43_9PLEO|nr:hypothetical protein K491DRAFT_141257 [Lophiostoma macrostomum CBS 122681]